MTIGFNCDRLDGAKLRIIPHSLLAGADSGRVGGDSHRPAKINRTNFPRTPEIGPRFALFVKLAYERLSKAKLRGFIKRRYGKLTKFAMTREELEDLLRLLKLYGPAICSRVTGEFNPPTQIPLDLG
ncbi:MAG: hypothetical protein ACRC8Y_03480 [Chroococcales cyanobacterium]